MKKGFLLALFLILTFPQFASASILIKLNPGTNPPTTEYAIFEKERNLYLQGNGTLQADVFWQTYEGWGGTEGFEILDLEEDAIFTFQIKARNATADETELSEPQNVTNVGSPRDLPEDFATLKAAVNVVSKGIFGEEDDEEVVAGMISRSIDTGSNVFLVVLSAFFLTFLIQFIVKVSQAKSPSLVPEYMVSRVRSLGFVIAIVFGLKLVLTAVVPTTFANWSPPPDTSFTADAVLANSGDVITYQVLLKNNETVRNNVNIMDVIPEGTTYIQGSIAVEAVLQTDVKDNDMAHYDSGKNEISITVPAVQKNQMMRVYFSVEVQ